MLDSRAHQNGDAARMFGIPGPLMEYSMAGGSLTYQNRAELMENFVTTCLGPYYLEPVEQTMSDLLANRTVARFDTYGITRADVKTRFDVYASGITSGVLTVEMAQEREGILPGDVETAAVPPAPPAAIPSQLPTPDASSLSVGTRTRAEYRCEGMANKRRNGVTTVERCNRLLATGGDVFVGQCPRCKRVYELVA
jgi:hypothetical protein